MYESLGPDNHLNRMKKTVYGGVLWETRLVGRHEHGCHPEKVRVGRSGKTVRRGRLDGAHGTLYPAIP